MKPFVVFGGLTLTPLSQALSLPSGLHNALSRLQYPDLLSHAERYLIELAPGETQWVTEEQKWAFRREGKNFFDITNTPELGSSNFHSTKKVQFPDTTSQNETVSELLKDLDKENMRSNLETFSGFYTRYYKSDWGRKSSEWLLEQVNNTLTAAGAGVVVAFPHEWVQSSIIATLPGKSDKTIVIGAHQDSINLFLPSLLSAPGADDDGSGTVTILEALRVLLTDKDILQGKAENTLEFHWYSAEEGGLLGSQHIFETYEREGRDVKAMLQQDMTGYTQGTIDAGKEVSVGVITDYVDPGLTEFIKQVINTYCTIPYVNTKCGYACSDHASASKAGYPSAFVIESEFKYSETSRIHTSNDKIEYLDFDHMLEHARLTLGLAYELAFTKFDDE